MYMCITPGSNHTTEGKLPLPQCGTGCSFGVLSFMYLLVSEEGVLSENQVGHDS